jgi:ribosomal protein S8
MSEFFEEVRGISQAFKENYAENTIRNAAIEGKSTVDIVPYGETITELIDRLKAHGFTTIYRYTPPHGRSIPSKHYVTVSWN